MNELQATLILSLLFALRCLLPLVLTLAIGYTMNRIVARWQAEEQAVALLTPPGQSTPPESRI